MSSVSVSVSRRVLAWWVAVAVVMALWCVLAVDSSSLPTCDAFDDPVAEWSESLPFVVGEFGEASMVLADMNNDGSQDMVVCNSNMVVIYFPVSPSSHLPGPEVMISSATSSPASREWTSLAVADLDGNGGRDVLFAVSSSQDIRAAMNDGSGGFSGSSIIIRAGAYAAAATDRVLAVADITGDGLPDVVYADGASETLAVLALATQSPLVFNPPALDAAYTGVTDVSVSDMAGDGGENELVVALGSSGLVWLAHDGASWSEVAVHGGAASRVIAGHDMNGDGRADVIVADTPSDLEVSWIAQGASGASLEDGSVRVGNEVKQLKFGATCIASSGAYPTLAVAVVDFDSNGRPDVVTTSAFYGTTVWISRGDGRFFVPERVVSSPFVVTAMVANDWDGDAMSDVAWLGGPLSDCSSSSPTDRRGSAMAVYVDLSTNTNLTAVSSAAIASSSDWHSVVAGDVTGDGLIDIVAVRGVYSNTGQRTVSLFVGLEDGGVSTTPIDLMSDVGEASDTHTSVDMFSRLELHDLDQDGGLDIVVYVRRGLYHPTGASVAGLQAKVIWSNGDGTFDAAAVPVGDIGGNTDPGFNLNPMKRIHPDTFTLYDVDGDGLVDLTWLGLVQSRMGGFYMLTVRNLGNRVFAPPATTGLMAWMSAVDAFGRGLSWSRTSDGHLRGFGVSANEAYLFVNSSASSSGIRHASTYTLDTSGVAGGMGSPQAVEMLDVDRDGVDDIVLAMGDGANGAVVWSPWPGLDANFVSPTKPALSSFSLLAAGTLGVRPTALVACDADNDGRRDLLVTSQRPGTSVGLYRSVAVPAGWYFEYEMLVAGPAMSYDVAMSVFSATSGSFGVAIADKNGLHLAHLPHQRMMLTLDAKLASPEYQVPGCVGEYSSTACFTQTVALRTRKCASSDVAMTVSAELRCPARQSLVPPFVGKLTVTGPADIVCDGSFGRVADVGEEARLVLQELTIRDALPAARQFQDVTTTGVMYVHGASSELRMENVTVQGIQSKAGVGAAVVVGDDGKVGASRCGFVAIRSTGGGGVVALVGARAVVELVGCNVTDAAVKTETVSRAVLLGGGGVVLVDGSDADVVLSETIVRESHAPQARGGVLLVTESATRARVSLNGVVMSETSAFAGGAIAVTVPDVGVAAWPQIVLDERTTVSFASATYGGVAVIAAEMHMPLPSYRTTLELAMGVSASLGLGAEAVINASMAAVGGSAQYGSIVFGCGAPSAWASGLDSYGAAFTCLADSPSPPTWWHDGIDANASVTAPKSMAVAAGVGSVASGLSFGRGSVSYVDGYGNPVRDKLLPLQVQIVGESGAELTGLGSGLLLAEGESTVSLAGLALSLPLDRLEASGDAGISASLTVFVSGGDTSELEATVVVQVTLCPPDYGRISPALANAPLLCALCVGSTFSSELTSDECMTPAECLSNAERGLLSVANCSDVVFGETDCVCLPGFYTRSGSINSECEACPSGGVCCGSSARPRPLPGFFESEPGKFVSCLRPAACAPEVGQVCAIGYEGYMCNTCSSGYYSDPEGRCRKCPNAATGLLGGLVAMVVIGALAAAGAVVFTALRAMPAAEDGRESDGSDDEAGVLLLDRFRRRPVPGTLSMALVALQIVGIFSEARFSWSSSSQAALSWANGLNVDLSFFASECSMPWFHTRYALSVLIFAVFFGLSAVFLAAAKAIGRCLGPARAGQLGRTSMVAMMEAVMFAAAPLLYIPMAKATLVLFDCTQLPNGTWVVDADPSVACFDSKWFAVLPVGIIGVVMYVLGLPSFVFVALFRSRGRLQTSECMARYGPLYKAFRLEYWYGGVGELGKRLVIVTIATFASRHQLVQLGGLVALLVFAIVFVKQNAPYVVPLHNEVDAQISLCLVSMLFFGGASYANRHAESPSRVVEVGTWACLLALGIVVVRAVVLDMRGIVAARSDPTRLRRERYARLVRTMEGESLELGPAATDAVLEFAARGPSKDSRGVMLEPMTGTVVDEGEDEVEGC
ncbi:uncharacterized protein AMSG_11426 [Thecamonas trahens ATCC 50062]|uniref:Uncharacterized protein n=1 Tax=Thecamonas trahens ATCC 50062 TaxID=461836 RepID=A0A0L0DUP0_THETB|nr:hypothetical protein AMSG_11426 [Thecamonas trahens ATCC 50062]KNC55950.1 hypothetical protein AMSG_11426 [Thecamonas trahens ATCC 50062]|eukprot:XP_013752691.1 hypothetical protein AMSG_11426 [Thecamonas trahens ATCC 50062]